MAQLTLEVRLRLHVLPELGSVRLDKLTPRSLDDLYAYLMRKKKLSPQSVEGIHRVIYGMLKFARRRRMVETNIAELVEAPAFNEYQARVLTIDEARALLAAVRSHSLGPFWIFMLVTGCRWGEAAGLPWSAVDLERGIAEIRQHAVRIKSDGHRVPVIRPAAKTKAGSRQLPLEPWVCELLREQRVKVAERQLAAENWQDLDLVFPGPGGKPLRENDVRKSWIRMLAKNRLPAIRQHDLRHTIGTAMADEDEQTLVIQRLLGHANMRITADLYIGRVPKAVRAASARWSKKLTDG